MVEAPAASKQEAAPLPPEEWSCQICTYLNNPSHLQCDMCGNPRPALSLSADPSSKKDDDGDEPSAVAPPAPIQTAIERLGLEEYEMSGVWSCPQCTFDNIAGSISCATCGFSRLAALEWTPVKIKMEKAAKRLEDLQNEIRGKLTLTRRDLRYDRIPNPSVADAMLAIRGVCNSKCCSEKRTHACFRVLSCGHPCNGVLKEHTTPNKKRNERTTTAEDALCLPCLECDLGMSRGDPEDGEEGQETFDCAFCSESLFLSPTIQLDSCGHLFHHQCVVKFLEQKWVNSWPKMSFSFLNCILCKQPMEHKMLDKWIQPLKRLERDVAVRALECLASDKGNLKVENKLRAWCGASDTALMFVFCCCCCCCCLSSCSVFFSSFGLVESYFFSFLPPTSQN